MWCQNMFSRLEYQYSEIILNFSQSWNVFKKKSILQLELHAVYTSLQFPCVVDILTDLYKSAAMFLLGKIHYDFPDLHLENS